MGPGRRVADGGRYVVVPFPWGGDPAPMPLGETVSSPEVAGPPRTGVAVDLPALEGAGGEAVMVDHGANDVAGWPPPTGDPVDVGTIGVPVGADPAGAVRVGAPRRPRGASAESAPSSMLEADGIDVWFGSRQVLEKVSLTMHPGEITALIGPSGCGKSTFLRTLNRMHELIPGASLAGRVKLDGVDIYGAVARPAEIRVKIGMVFQRPNPFPAMSIAQNVTAGLMLNGRRRSSDDLIETCLRRAGLWEETRNRLHQSARALSGGQQQRLCIARALAVNPRIILMDEPCSALDPISTRVIEDTMLAIKDEVTIIIVTHNMAQASRVSDQCALFLVDEEDGPGRIVEAGSTSDVFGSPVDARTADYIAGRFG